MGFQQKRALRRHLRQPDGHPTETWLYGLGFRVLQALNAVLVHVPPLAFRVTRHLVDDEGRLHERPAQRAQPGQSCASRFCRHLVHDVP